MAGDADRDDRVERFRRGLVDLADEGVAVDEVGDGLSDRELADDRVVHVEDHVLDFGAVALHHLDAALLRGGRGVQGGYRLGAEAAIGDVDVAVLQCRLEGLLVASEELQGHARVLHLGGSFIAGVDREDGFPLVDGIQLVGARTHRLATFEQAVLGVDPTVHYGAAPRGDLAGERRVGHLEAEDDGLVVRGSDRRDRGEQWRGARRVVDPDRPVEGVLHVRRREAVAVAELQPVTQGAGVGLAAVGEPARLGRLRHGSGRSWREAQQGLEHVVEQQPGPRVVPRGRIRREDVVGHPDDHPGLGARGAASRQ